MGEHLDFEEMPVWQEAQDLRRFGVRGLCEEP